MKASTIMTAVSLGLLAYCPAEAQGPPQAADSADHQSVVEQARIPSENGAVLAATLRLPAGDIRHPVLIIQAGSGPNTRGAYPSLQDRLLKAGIATLEFDKRCVGESTGKFTDTMDDMEADLAAAITWLRCRHEIDGARIALLGHSQGAAAAPVVADRDGHLGAVVFLAGPVGDRGTMFLQRMHAQILQGGHTPLEADRIVAATRTWMEARSRGDAAERIADARSALVTASIEGGFQPGNAEKAVETLDTPQLLSMYNVGTGPALERLRIPVLVVLAGRDEEVGNSEPAAIAALAENPDALVVEVPGAGHLFTYRAAGSTPGGTAPGRRWLLPEALITDWLAEHLQPPSQRAALAACSTKAARRTGRVASSVQ